MITAVYWTILLLTDALAQESHSSTDADGLFLTPYIEKCDYETAKQLSKVHFFESYGAHVTVYSGYITVKKETNSNLFFLLTEAEGGSSSAPLLLWTQGGPGLSALFGLFLENGPLAFGMDSKMQPVFRPRINTLQKNMSVLYVDVPVGAGFSFTNDTKGYPKNMQDVVNDVIAFLTQFLELFSEYKNRQFYLAGESYGARYAVAIANEILTKKNGIEVDLKGIIGGNGFLGPVLDTAESSSFLYEVSMLTEEGRDKFAQRFSIMKILFQQGNITATLGMLFSTIFADPTWAAPTLFQQLTLYSDHASPLYTTRPFNMLACFAFLNNSLDFRKAIHVGTKAIFQYNNQGLLHAFAVDWLVNITTLIEKVLQDIDVLFYTGQLDALFPSVNQRTYFHTLQWEYAQEYRDAKRSSWKPHDKYYGNAGYTKVAGNFVDAVLLGMSHYGAVDKPDEVYYLITQFIANSFKIPPQSSLPEEAQRASEQS